MITCIKLSDETHNLKPFQIDNPPPLMVIAGANGAGKTAFLQYIYQENGKRSYKIVQMPQGSTLVDKIRYLPVGYVPGDIFRSTNNPPLHISQVRAREIIKYIKAGKWHDPKRDAIALKALTKLNTTIVNLDATAAAFSESLTEQDLWEALPNDFALIMQDFEQNDFIAEVCLNFKQRYSDLKVKLYDTNQHLTESQIYTRLGSLPPWVEINELFQKYGFGYRLNEPGTGIEFIPRFKKVDGSQTIDFNSLSSGEKILVTLVLWGFNSHQGNHFSLLLLDEFDAHLNPTLAKMMMEIVSESLVKKNGLTVIMTTHSPSTVAYTDDQNLFWMEAGKPIRSATKAEIVPLLSDGFITVQPDQALGIVGRIVDKSDKPALCVEGRTDREILTTAWQKLHADTPMPFDIYDVFDCYFLINMFARGDIFQNYPDKVFWGLLDFDSAYTNAKEKLLKQGWTDSIKTEPTQVLFSHPDKNAVLMTLPVPEERNHYAGADIANSYLSIELLFSDSVLLPHCTETKVSGGASLLKFNDKKKTVFARLVQDLDENAFSNFKPLFDRLIGMS